MKLILFIIIATLTIFMNVPPKDSTENQTIFNFTPNANIDDWMVLNDGVMGGVSQSRFSLNAEGKGNFRGTVSTANNGGFASVQYRMDHFDVSAAKKVQIRLKGDGKEYQFRIKNRISDYHSYIHTFDTDGSWQTIELCLSDFLAQFRGRKLDQPNFNHESIEQVSFLIANDVNEEFHLIIDKITLI